MNCILCDHTAKHFMDDLKRQRRYFHCFTCDLRFMDPGNYLDDKAEYERYLTHQNDIHDVGYQSFVKPLYEVIKKHTMSNHKGLDFGCGDGPVLTHLLEKEGYQISLYDPYFRPDKSVLDHQYDFIFSIEVIEHLFRPAKEIEMLKTLLMPKGQLLFMTLMFDDSIDFESWWYRQDPTHVAFFSKTTFEWIQRRFNFTSCEIYQNRVARFVV